MTSSAQNRTTRVLSVCFALMICLFALFAFVGCDSDETISPIAYNLYLAGCSYDEATLTVTAHVAISGSAQQRLEGLRAEGLRRFSKDDLFFNMTRVAVSLDCAAIYDAVEGRGVLTRETVQTNEAGEEIRKRTEFQYLKVVVRYDTIYKSVVTNGVRHPSGAGYVDILPLAETGEQTFELSQRTQNSANWYSLLVAAGIALLAALTAIYLAVMNKKERAEAAPEEGSRARSEQEGDNAQEK